MDNNNIQIPDDILKDAQTEYPIQLVTGEFCTSTGTDEHDTNEGERKAYIAGRMEERVSSPVTVQVGYTEIDLHKAWARGFAIGYTEGMNYNNPELVQHESFGEWLANYKKEKDGTSK